MIRLLQSTPRDESWIAGLLADKPAGRELYRDADHGFIQMGHFHRAGHHNAPHDHGPCWVVYGVYEGEVEIATYRRTDDGSVAGKAFLEVAGSRLLKPGIAYEYLSGEIHSTRCLSDGAIVMRFLSADLEKVSRGRYNLEAGTVTAI